MDARLRRGPSISIFFALFCFMLPFLTISCPGGRHTFNGVELAVGATVDESGGRGGEVRKLDPEPLATIALGLTIVAALTSLPLRRLPRLLTGALGGLGLMLLILLKSKLERDALVQGFHVSWGPGFWLALLGYAATVATVILVLGDPGRAEAAPAPDWVRPGPDRVV